MTRPASIVEALELLGNPWDPDDVEIGVEWRPDPQVPSRREVDPLALMIKSLTDRYNAIQRDPSKRLPVLPVPEPQVPITYVTLPAGPEVDGARREETARRLMGFIGNPVHSTRRPAVRAALKEEARLHGRSPGRELQERGVAAALEILPGIRLYGLLAVPREQEIRAKLNKIVTEDVLGPAWRRKHGQNAREVGLEEVSDVSSPGDPHRLMELLSAVDTARLTPREQEVLSIHRNRDEQQGDADLASLLGIPVSTYRVHLHNARKKISSLI